MSRYLRKQETVDVIQYLGDENISSVMEFCPMLRYSSERDDYYVLTPIGVFMLRYGDYIVKDSFGEFHYYHKDNF